MTIAKEKIRKKQAENWGQPASGCPNIDSKYVQFFKRTENCPDNCKNIGEIFANNTPGLRRLKCRVINTVNLKRKLLMCGLTATEFSLRSEVDQ